MIQAGNAYGAVIDLQRENQRLRAELKAAINIIKYAQRRGFEGPADPMEVIEAAGRVTSVSEPPKTDES